MVTLTNPSPLQPSSTKKKIPFKQINTENYDVQRVQSNVQQTIDYISDSMENSFIEVTAYQNTDVPFSITANIPLAVFINTTVSDSTQAYNAPNGAFKAAHKGVFSTVLNAIFTLTSGTPTAFFVNLVSNVQGTIATFLYPNPSGTFYINFPAAVSLNNNETLTYQMVSNANADLKLIKNSRVYFGGST